MLSPAGGPHAGCQTLRVPAAGTGGGGRRRGGTFLLSPGRGCGVGWGWGGAGRAEEGTGDGARAPHSLTARRQPQAEAQRQLQPQRRGQRPPPRRQEGTAAVRLLPMIHLLPTKGIRFAATCNERVAPPRRCPGLPTGSAGLPRAAPARPGTRSRPLRRPPGPAAPLAVTRAAAICGAPPRQSQRYLRGCCRRLRRCGSAACRGRAERTRTLTHVHTPHRRTGTSAHPAAGRPYLPAGQAAAAAARTGPAQPPWSGGAGSRERRERGQPRRAKHAWQPRARPSSHSRSAARAARPAGAPPVPGREAPQNCQG